MKKLLTLIWLAPLLATAQFDPAGGEPGSKAIHRNDAAFGYWADSVKLVKGLQQINTPGLGPVTLGQASDALGAPDNSTVSLGDGGQATFYFDQPIVNIEGADFAVFENGFKWPGGYFLELAFIEVSSNGKDFVRFPATSKADTTKQTSNLAYMECEWFDNLAGKHQAPYGTPFDLEELKDSSDELKIDSVRYIRIVDVVGSLNDSFASYDQFGTKINEPWPTNFPSGGFDLDALGILEWAVSTNDLHERQFRFGPNPARANVDLNVYFEFEEAWITNGQGSVIEHYENGQSQLLAPKSTGIYFVQFKTRKGLITRRLCVY